MRTPSGLASPQRLTQLIQAGLLVLVGLMPFHAFLTVWLGTALGHRSLIQGWKEALLVILTGLTIVLIVREPARLQRLRRPLVYCALGFVALGLLITVITQPSLTAVVFGIKTDTEFLLAFLIALAVGNGPFVRRLILVTLSAGTVVIGFGLLQAYVLPADFLTHFGYGPDTIQPYLTLDPAVNSLRFGSTLGGPNQLGAYLTLILCLSLAIGWKRQRWLLLLVPLGGLASINTYSRAAWIGALAGLAVVTFGLIPARRRWWAIIGLAIAAVLGLIVTPSLTSQHQDLQYYLFHGSQQWHDQRGSDFEHAASLQTGIQSVSQQPLGHGFGTAGPTFFYTGNGRVIENYYLQLGYELGVLGMVLFVVLLALIVQRLWKQGQQHPASLAVAAAVIGISVNALVLPAWTDSTTALVTWTLAGALLGHTKPETTHV